MMSGFSLLPVYYEISGSRMKESSLRSTFYMLKIWIPECGNWGISYVLELTMCIS